MAVPQGTIRRCRRSSRKERHGVGAQTQPEMIVVAYHFGAIDHRRQRHRRLVGLARLRSRGKQRQRLVMQALDRPQ